jgi:hypothetical protein
MPTTVLDALMNAQINFETSSAMQGAMRNAIHGLAMEQLKNGIEALENGMTPYDEIQEHIGAPINTGNAA